jgi:hypothetical protein
MAAPKRGMPSPRELHALRHLLSAELTESALAWWGVEALLSALDRRNGLGFTLPSTTRRGLWWKLVDLAPALRTREAARGDKTETEARRAHREAEAARALHALAGYHAKKIRPRVAALPPLPSVDELLGFPAPAGAAVLPFPPSRRRTPPRGHDDGPQGAA